ncbi:MAG: hypothetical protein K8R41_11210 [Bacteroidales bacterium]|nr:hypothetical protein [Bacteroidales bacterium]
MLKRQEIIDFDKIFKNEDYNEYLNKIGSLPKTLLIKASTFLLSFNKNDSFVQNHRELLYKWFGKENNGIANEINQTINNYIKVSGHEINIINPRSSLVLFENVLSIENIPKSIKESDFELLLFKVYLALNQKLNENDILITDTAKNNKDYPELINMAISMSLPIFDITNYDINTIFISQVLRAIYLFEFLEDRKEARTLLSEFYKRFDVNGYKEYLGKILLISESIISAKNQGNINLVINEDKDFETNVAFLDKLSVNHIVNEDETPKDYLYLRKNPIIRIDRNTYQIIFPLFAIEKNFNGLYFILKEINDNLPKETKINLRQLITFEFSEKYILYQLLDNIFKNKYFKLKGEEMVSPGAPDYYIRNGNKIFIFESKDILISAKIKYCYDFSKYEKELKEKLYFYNNGKSEQAKAVKQLMKFTKQLLTDFFNEDQNYKPNSIKVYPVIILHNRQLDILGLNNLINIWFEKELEIFKLESINVSNVRKITIINIDTILIFQEQISSGIIKLDEILDEYQNWIDKSRLEKKKFKTENDYFAAIQDSLVSFNMFIFNKYSWKPPKAFKEKAYSLIESP